MRKGRWIYALAIVGLLNACTNDAIVLRDLTERDANEVVATLYASAIDARKTQDSKTKTYAVQIRESDLARSVAILQALGLPKETKANLSEIFKATGFAPTAFEERIRFIYGVTQELERTIAMMPGVLQVRVHLSLPEQSRAKKQLENAKASVFLVYDDRYDLELQLPQIRKMVSEGVERLEPDAIEVLATPTKVNLKPLTQLPFVEMAGLRIHRDDLALFLIYQSALFMVIVGLLVGREQINHWRALALAALQKARNKTGSSAKAP